MAFSPETKAEALVACGRSCCICHRFRGTKIECHHIRPEEAEGTDAAENCIPVCFDCHADMRSYDFKHPKGNKYSESELRLHRDRWFERVAQSGALSVAHKYADVDRKVYQRFFEVVPHQGTIDFMRKWDFGGSFERDSVNPLLSYLHEAERPDYQFLDATMENARAIFVAAARSFASAYARDTFASPTPDIRSVPPEWQTRDPARWDAAVSGLNEAADAAVKAYDDLYLVGRRRLGVQLDLDGSAA